MNILNVVGIAIGLALAGEAVLAQDAEVFEYDVHGRLVAIQRPTNTTTLYSIDPVDNRQVKSIFDQFDAIWQAESLPHQIGYPVADGWGADTLGTFGFMTYGPYVTTVPVGMTTATWRIRIDNTTSPGANDIVTFDVWDATTSSELASLTVNRYAWAAANIYQDFEVPFARTSALAGHELEFRTYYRGHAAVVVDEIGYRHSGGVWLAATELPHNIGYADSNGWVADTSMSPGHMTYGPYAAVAVGARQAVWRMMVDNVSSPDTLPVVTLDVWDATNLQQLAAITLDRHAWAAANTFQEIRRPFVQDGSRAGHQMEFRTFYNGNAKVTIQWIGVE